VNNTVKIKGRIQFDPPDRTKKHKKQSEWKKVAMIELYGDLCEYYAWFLRKRYSINLHKPLRKAHITFINDRVSDMNGKWEEVKEEWDGKEIEVTLNLEPRTDSAEGKGRTTYNWWLNIPNEEREQLHNIRAELGLGRPYFGLHMTIGRAVNFVPEGKFEDGAVRAKEMNVEQSIYIHNLFLKGFIS
jgi:hypothetical protein